MTTLPRDLQALLDDATSEAKKLGHGSVTPAHLVTALRRRRPDDDVIASLADKASGLLDNEARTFSTPSVQEATTGILSAGAETADPMAVVLSGLQEYLAAVPVPPARPAMPEAGHAAAGPPAAIEQDAASTTTVDPTPLEVAGVGLPEWVRPLVSLMPTESPAVPRLDVARRLAAMLSARTPQIPLLVAAEGQGRSSVAQCLAGFLASGEAVAPVAGMPVLRVKAEPLLTKSRDGALSSILEASRGKAIVMIDDLEVVCSLGWSAQIQGGVMAVLRGSLDDPEQRVVLCVASEFVDRFQTTDTELFAELERVDLPPLTEAEIRAVADREAADLAAYHGVTIPDDVVSAALAPPRQVDSRAHPALAVHRLDRAAAAARMSDDHVARAEDLGPAVSAQQYVAFDSDAARRRLGDVIVGQDESLDAVTRRLAVTRASLDMRPERPDGVFLFAGPTGTGKTALALALADELFGTQEALIRLDMSEYAESHTISKLVGSPPGYIGSDEPESWLTTKIRRRPQTMLLLDEIEKAHPQVWNTFLQVFDAGRLTDSQGRIADFRDVVVVLTTNIGADVFDQRQGPGFVESSGSALADRRAVVERLKTWMRPELLNRLDEILVFRPLTATDVRSIAHRRLAEVLASVGNRGWQITFDEGVVDLLVERGFSPEYGARPLIRAIESLLLEPISRLVPGRYAASVTDGQVTFVLT